MSSQVSLLSEAADRPRRRKSDREAVTVPVAPPHSSFIFGFCEDKNAGRRRKMEVKDQGLFAIFDGHGGRTAAAWCGEHFHELLAKNLPGVEKVEETIPVPEILDQTFVEADGYLNAAHGIFSGCTAVVALLRPERRDNRPCRILYTANAGDSRAVLLRGDRAIRLSYDHKGSDPLEQQRIKDAGGFIMNERVNGMLAITRSLGDSEMKDYVAGRPYTTETIIDDSRDSLLILACDGLWDVCTDQEACELVRDTIDPQEAAHMLVEYGLAQGSCDNISVLVVRLQREHERERESDKKEKERGREKDR